jgi:hypothetical protein
MCSSPRIRLTVEINRAAPFMLAPEREAGPVDRHVLLAVLLDRNGEPPTGHVHHGAFQWRFGNRVELLEAIDAAGAIAARDTNQRRRT